MSRVVLRRLAPMLIIAIVAVVFVAAPAAASEGPAPTPAVALNVWRSGSIGLEAGWAAGEGPDVGLTMDSLSLMVGARVRGFELVGGVASFRWGPGRNGSLALSGAVDPMPVVGYRVLEEKADYIRFVGLMERDGNRILVGHRLNYQPTPWLSVGINETAVLSEDPSALFYFPFPGLPVYALQHVIYQQDRRRGNDANVNLGGDFTLRFRDVEIYGELLIDDAQGTLSDRKRVPDFVGVLGGFEVRRAVGDRWVLTGNAEYTRINNYVYSHRVPNNCYTYHEVGLGHPLGPDADAVVLTLKAEGLGATLTGGAPGVASEAASAGASAADPDAAPVTRIELKASFERHGEGHIGLPWRSEFGTDHIFLSGVVEKLARVELAAERRLAGGVWVTAEAGLARAENHDNLEGADWRGWNAGLGLKLEL
jgi:hypothetical protein